MSARVTLIGTVGKEPEVKVSAKGNSYAQFSIATWTGKKGEDRWWKVMAFGPIADRALALVRRGSYIEVEGKFDYSEREYQGKRYQDFTCFCERIDEKEKPIGKVPTLEQSPEIDFNDPKNIPSSWGKGVEAMLRPDAKDHFDRENQVKPPAKSGSLDDLLSNIPF